MSLSYTNIDMQVPSTTSPSSPGGSRAVTVPKHVVRKMVSPQPLQQQQQRIVIEQKIDETFKKLVITKRSRKNDNGGEKSVAARTTSTVEQPEKQATQPKPQQQQQQQQTQTQVNNNNNNNTNKNPGTAAPKPMTTLLSFHRRNKLIIGRVVKQLRVVQGAIEIASDGEEHARTRHRRSQKGNALERGMNDGGDGDGIAASSCCSDCCSTCGSYSSCCSTCCSYDDAACCSSCCSRRDDDSDSDDDDHELRSSSHGNTNDPRDRSAGTINSTATTTTTSRPPPHAAGNTMCAAGGGTTINNINVNLRTSGDHEASEHQSGPENEATNFMAQIHGRPILSQPLQDNNNHNNKNNDKCSASKSHGRSINSERLIAVDNNNKSDKRGKKSPQRRQHQHHKYHRRYAENKNNNNEDDNKNQHNNGEKSKHHHPRKSHTEKNANREVPVSKRPHTCLRKRNPSDAKSAAAHESALTILPKKDRVHEHRGCIHQNHTNRRDSPRREVGEENNADKHNKNNNDDDDEAAGHETITEKRRRQKFNRNPRKITVLICRKKSKTNVQNNLNNHNKEDGGGGDREGDIDDDEAAVAEEEEEEHMQSSRCSSSTSAAERRNATMRVNAPKEPAPKSKNNSGDTDEYEVAPFISPSAFDCIDRLPNPQLLQQHVNFKALKKLGAGVFGAAFLCAWEVRMKDEFTRGKHPEEIDIGDIPLHVLNSVNNVTNLRGSTSQLYPQYLQGNANNKNNGGVAVGESNAVAMSYASNQNNNNNKIGKFVSEVTSPTNERSEPHQHQLFPVTTALAFGGRQSQKPQNDHLSWNYSNKNNNLRASDNSPSSASASVARLGIQRDSESMVSKHNNILDARTNINVDNSNRSHNNDNTCDSVEATTTTTLMMNRNEAMQVRSKNNDGNSNNTNNSNNNNNNGNNNSQEQQLKPTQQQELLLQSMKQQYYSEDPTLALFAPKSKLLRYNINLDEFVADDDGEVDAKNKNGKIDQHQVHDPHRWQPSRTCRNEKQQDRQLFRSQEHKIRKLQRLMDAERSDRLRRKLVLERVNNPCGDISSLASTRATVPIVDVQGPGSTGLAVKEHPRERLVVCKVEKIHPRILDQEESIFQHVRAAGKDRYQSGTGTNVAVVGATTATDATNQISESKPGGARSSTRSTGAEGDFSGRSGRSLHQNAEESQRTFQECDSNAQLFLSASVAGMCSNTCATKSINAASLLNNNNNLAGSQHQQMQSQLQVQLQATSPSQLNNKDVVANPDNSEFSTAIAMSSAADRNRLSYAFGLEYYCRLKREAQLLSNLAHPNIVAYVDCYRRGDKQYLFLEYLDGGDLEKEILRRAASKRDLSISSVLFIFVQIVLGVEYLHRHNIIHRDLKLANCLLSRYYFCKISDLGTSERFDFDISASRIVSGKGTALYQSPECMMCHAYSEKSDMYSLGVILYCLLCPGHFPFFSPDFQSLRKKVLFGDPRPIDRADVPYPVQHLLIALLDRNPDSRPTALQVLQIPTMQAALKYYIDRVEKIVKSGEKQNEEQRLQQASTPQSMTSKNEDLHANSGNKYNTSPTTRLDHIWLDVLKDHAQLIKPQNIVTTTTVQEEGNNRENKERVPSEKRTGRDAIGDENYHLFAKATSSGSISAKNSQQSRRDLEHFRIGVVKGRTVGVDVPPPLQKNLDQQQQQ